MNSVRSVLVLRGMLMKLDGGTNCATLSRSWHSSARLEIRGRPRILEIRPQPTTPKIRPETSQIEGDAMNVGQGKGDAAAANRVISNEVRDDRTNTNSGGYRYFKNFAEHASSVFDSASSQVRKNPQNLSFQSARTDNSLEVGGDILNRVTKGKMIEAALKSDSTMKPALPKKSFNLAAYVGESETLTNLVKLGVDLTKMELDAETSSCLVKLDFENDIQPYLAFLHRNGVQDANIGVCITRNPKIFLIPFDHLEARVNYLKSKKFSEESIGRILGKFPQLFSLTTKQIDGRLGFLQKQFKLSGEEVRLVVTRFPKITLWDQKSIQMMKMTYKDFLGFSEPELKQLLLADPKLYSSGKHAIMKRFEYIHNVIGFSHQDILAWPNVLRVRLMIIKPRHLFLKQLGRDQFDPKKENFVSLKSLALGRDVEFCEKFAKVPVQEFNDFMKTL